MKNKILIILLYCVFISENLLNANEFIIESAEVEILEKGNITNAKKGVKIISNDGIEISSNELIYNKKKNILRVFGDVKIKDKKNNIITEGEEYIYYKNIEKIESKGKTNSKIQDKYIIESLDLIYERNLSKIHSQNESNIIDQNNNNFFLDKFEFNIDSSILKAKDLSLLDNLNNQYYLSFAVVNLKENKFLGSDIFIDFEDNLFGNNENDPRLKANSLISEKNETKVYKGSFTTCKEDKDKEKCPPWAIYAEEIVHKKKERRIEYKNAWLKVYDKPVLYFPYFFHPDPTVKRQSGFLMPSFQSSNNFGTSLQIPYYKVISDRKDLTFSPRLFFDNASLIQTEYRQANKNSDLILDFSIFNDENSTKNHFFADISSKNQNKTLNFHIEKVTNDNYLKSQNIISSIKNDDSSLKSYFVYGSDNYNSSFDISFEVYEDLNKKKSDRFEYIFPNFKYEKKLYNDSKINGEMDFNSRGYKKMYETNIDESILVNDITYLSNPRISSNIDGLQTNYELLIRNLNSDSSNSDNFKSGLDQKLLSTLLLDYHLPLKKENEFYKNYLSPKLSLRYSPNETKNNSDLNKKLTYENIYAIDRIDDTAVEGGESLTAGFEYSSKNKKNENYYSLSIASIFRLDENPDLPKIHGISNKRSDLIGNFNLVPSKFFDLNYQFSLDKNLDNLNYNLIEADININNLVTSFEFLKEDNYLSQDSYLSNSTKFNFDENKSLSFGTSKNLDKNITNYYNIIYEYQNDCLTAAVEYNKNYYTDGDLKPEENLLFSIKIIPFGNIISPYIK